MPDKRSHMCRSGFLVDVNIATAGVYRCDKLREPSYHTTLGLAVSINEEAPYRPTTDHAG